MKKIGEDEVAVTGITVNIDGKKQNLAMIDDYTFLQGDTGYILFDDINFDGQTDIAVTTSFGTPNLYLNYWVFEPRQNQFKFVGNYSRLKLNHKDKILSNTEKVSAAKYINNQYFWKNGVLTKK